MFVGDALFVGGNDYPVQEAGVASISVRGPNETKVATAAIIACLSRVDENDRVAKGASHGCAEQRSDARSQRHGQCTPEQHAP